MGATQFYKRSSKSRTHRLETRIHCLLLWKHVQLSKIILPLENGYDRWTNKDLSIVVYCREYIVVQCNARKCSTVQYAVQCNILILCSFRVIKTHCLYNIWDIRYEEEKNTYKNKKKNLRLFGMTYFWQTRCSRGCPTNTVVSKWYLYWRIHLLQYA